MAQNELGGAFGVPDIAHVGYVRLSMCEEPHSSLRSTLVSFHHAALVLLALGK